MIIKTQQINEKEEDQTIAFSQPSVHTRPNPCGRQKRKDLNKGGKGAYKLINHNDDALST